LIIQPHQAVDQSGGGQQRAGQYRQRIAVDVAGQLPAFAFEFRGEILVDAKRKDAAAITATMVSQKTTLKPIQRR
jgi:hypothetical protein